MDLQSRFAIFTAVGVASFSAGLSLTTACSRVDARPEPVMLKPALPTETKAPTTPAAVTAANKPSQSTPTPKPSAKPTAEATSPAKAKLAVNRLVVTHAVADHEPVSPAELVTDAPVLAFVELANQDSIERNVVVTFEREGHLAVGYVKLHVPASSKRFRTWARTHNLGSAGTWEAVVRAEDGTELGRQPFELSESLGPA
jgi:hypothetical protein